MGSVIEGDCCLDATQKSLLCHEKTLSLAPEIVTGIKEDLGEKVKGSNPAAGKGVFPQNPR